MEREAKVNPQANPAWKREPSTHAASDLGSQDEPKGGHLDCGNRQGVCSGEAVQATKCPQRLDT